MSIAARVEAVRRRIESAGGRGRVKLVAVSKGFGADAVTSALAAGVDGIGENYAQELLAKSAEVTAPVEWHFVGQLQTNKVRQLLPVVKVWQTVDRAPLVDELGRRAPGAAVLVQVSATGEPERGGCPPAAASGVVARCRQAGLDVRGLMALGPPGDAAASRAAFRRVSRLADDLGLAERSMGMTDDLEVAVEEGSTMVRVGRGIFGERPSR